MADEFLGIYLNDHLAGSVVAIELLQHIERAYVGRPVERFAAELRAEIQADQQELQRLMGQLNVTESRARQATAWLTEKMTMIKLRLDDWAGGDFRLFEALEAISLGIEGKKSLWVVLAGATEKLPALGLLDYSRLVERALDQRGRVEAKRLETANAALVPAR